MLLKSPQIRKFTYHPIFYQPEEEEEGGPRIKFRRRKSANPPKKRSLLGMIILVIILIFLLSYWLRIESTNKKEFKFNNIRIEEIK